MNLFHLAADNTCALQQRTDDLHEAHRNDQHARERMTRFADCIARQGRVAINMRPEVLSRFLSTGRYSNIYEWADEAADLSGRDRETLLAEKLGTFKERRLAFDAAFSGSERFRYGALNIGGVGAAAYGTFCFVAHSSFGTAPTSAAYLRADSLKTYVDATGSLLEESLRSDLATPSHRGHLALLKHAAEIESTADWASLLCSESDYIEVIFTEELRPEHGEEIRIATEAHQRLWSLTFESFGRKLDDGARALQADFLDILRRLRDASLTLTEI
jgi:hypothetical protein